MDFSQQIHWIILLKQIIEVINKADWLSIGVMSPSLRKGINAVRNIEKKFDEIIEVRGAGLLLGIKVKSDNIIISNLLTENGLLNVPANDSVIRLAPPLIITESEIDEALKIIEKVFGKINE